MDLYKKNGKQYEVGVSPDGRGTVTVTDENGNRVNHVIGVDAVKLIHREFNADGTPWTHYDPDRPF